MSEVDNGLQIEKKFEPLSLKVDFKKKDLENKTATILVGNSGLEFVIIRNDDKESYNMHFNPEGHIDSPRWVKMPDRVKYSFVFCSAFYEFYQWWLNSENSKDILHPQFITGITNETMHKFREGIFNQNGNILYETIKKQKDDKYINIYDYKIDLSKFGENPEILENLKEIYDKKDNIKMEV